MHCLGLQKGLKDVMDFLAEQMNQGSYLLEEAMAIVWEKRRRVDTRR